MADRRAPRWPYFGLSAVIALVYMTVVTLAERHIFYEGAHMPPAATSMVMVFAMTIPWRPAALLAGGAVHAGLFLFWNLYLVRRTDGRGSEGTWVPSFAVLIGTVTLSALHAISAQTGTRIWEVARAEMTFYAWSNLIAVVVLVGWLTLMVLRARRRRTAVNATSLLVFNAVLHVSYLVVFLPLPYVAKL